MRWREGTPNESNDVDAHCQVHMNVTQKSKETQKEESTND